MKTRTLALAIAVSACLCGWADGTADPDVETLSYNGARAGIGLLEPGELRTYELRSTAELREHRPPDGRVVFSESPRHARVRTGNIMFDGLYALAVHEALQNSVSEIKDGAYGNGAPVALEAFQTGEFWTYVWTRDLAYSVHLALAGYDPERAVSSLLFKTSPLKPTVNGGHRRQIIQDTGSGGSYPVSTDRIVWALGASEALNYLEGPARERFLKEIYPILRDTIEQDRRLVFDPKDGLYRGEQSFLDWREQTYPGWTKDNVLPIALSKALSVNVANHFLLRTTAEYARQLGDPAAAQRYAFWARDLKTAINERFVDPDTGLYSAYLFSEDGLQDIRVRRYDLLAVSLAILTGVAEPSRGAVLLNGYPVGPHGPPVVWPQERTVPIYHNQGIWPFVTAYWIKAARQVGHWAAVDHGIQSLERLAALNLSNMENYDFVTGRAQVEGAARTGPVINSRRQLWSVAGYLSMVQDVVFGLETSGEGIRFRPFITGRLRNATLGSGDVVELRDFSYHDTRHTVCIHLPPRDAGRTGVCGIERVQLNGQAIGDRFVAASDLQSSNRWDIDLQAAETTDRQIVLSQVDVGEERAYCAPAQPVWVDGDAAGADPADPVLRFDHPDAAHVAFNLYRDGALCVRGLRQGLWRDPSWSEVPQALHAYTVEAVDLQSGNVSHLSPIRRAGAAAQPVVIAAKRMRNVGGQLVRGHHFENWGRPQDELVVRAFRVEQGGRFAVRAQFSNGSGPVNTGITCAIKRVEVREAGSENVVAGGYWIMPQSGDWARWDLSSPVQADLSADTDYALWIGEDAYCRNMSCLERNENYTAWPGGGPQSYNYVNIASVQLTRCSDSRLLARAE